jgi:hypothetical protein
MKNVVRSAKMTDARSSLVSNDMLALLFEDCGGGPTSAFPVPLAA